MAVRPGLPSDKQVWISAGLTLVLPLLLRLLDRLWVVTLLDALQGSRPVNVAVGAVCSAGWYTIPLAAVFAQRHRNPRPTWPWWAFLGLGFVTLMTLPTRGDSAYNDALADRVPGFVPGFVAGVVPLLALGLCMAIGSAVARFRRHRR